MHSSKSGKFTHVHPYKYARISSQQRFIMNMQSACTAMRCITKLYLLKNNKCKYTVSLCRLGDNTVKVYYSGHPRYTTISLLYIVHLLLTMIMTIIIQRYERVGFNCRCCCMCARRLWLYVILLLAKFSAAIKVVKIICSYHYLRCR